MSFLPARSSDSLRDPGGRQSRQFLWEGRMFSSLFEAKQREDVGESVLNNCCLLPHHLAPRKKRSTKCSISTTRLQSLPVDIPSTHLSPAVPWYF